MARDDVIVIIWRRKVNHVYCVARNVTRQAGRALYGRIAYCYYCCCCTRPRDLVWVIYLLLPRFNGSSPSLLPVTSCYPRFCVKTLLSVRFVRFNPRRWQFSKAFTRVSYESVPHFLLAANVSQSSYLLLTSFIVGGFKIIIRATVNGHTVGFKDGITDATPVYKTFASAVQSYCWTPVTSSVTLPYIIVYRARSLQIVLPQLIFIIADITHYVLNRLLLYLIKL